MEIPKINDAHTIDCHFNRRLDLEEFVRFERAANLWTARDDNEAKGVKEIQRLGGGVYRIALEGAVGRIPKHEAVTHHHRLRDYLLRAGRKQAEKRDQHVVPLELGKIDYHSAAGGPPAPKVSPKTVGVADFRQYRLPKRPWDRIAAECGGCGSRRPFRWSTEVNAYACESCKLPLSVVYAPIREAS